MAGAEPLLKFALVLAQAGMNLSAIAARGAKSHVFGFEHDHARAAFGRLKRGGQSCVARANNADVGRTVTREHKTLRPCARALGIPAPRFSTHRNNCGSSVLLRSSGKFARAVM